MGKPERLKEEAKYQTFYIGNKKEKIITMKREEKIPVLFECVGTHSHHGNETNAWAYRIIMETICLAD